MAVSTTVSYLLALLQIKKSGDLWGTARRRRRFVAEVDSNLEEEDAMGLGRGALLWLLGIPLPIIILLALFWHH
jgi:hypothetical protein